MPPSTSSSLPVDDTIEVLRSHIKDATLLNAVVKDLLAAQREVAQAKAAEAEANKGVKTKNRYTVLIRADPGEAAKLRQLVAAGGYVLTVPDDDTTDTYSGDGLLGRISTAARTFNDSLKRKKTSRLIKSFIQAMENLKAKAIKSSGSNFSIKNRYPAEIIVVDKEEVL